MTFWVLDANPVQSANRLCWLDCESAAFEGARIVVSAFKHHAGEIDEIGAEPLDKHPLVRWAIVSADNARWLYRYTRAATIKWGGEGKEKPDKYNELMQTLNKVASRIDKIIPHKQLTLFGNFYLGEPNPVAARVANYSAVESNRAYYERTREHLMWADHEPTLYDKKGDDEE